VFVVTLVIGSIQLGHNLQALVPTLGLFGFAALRLMPSANSISTSLINIRFNRHAISLLYADLVALKETRQTKSSTDPVLKKDGYFRDLTFRDVQFTYQKTKCPALKQVTFNIRAGESIGLIGPSGSGKTTMVDVVLGLVEPQKGEIYYNGKDLIESLDEWRAQVAYLPQQVFLIDNSLRNNIALGMEDEEIDDVQLHEAIRQARLTELAEQLPDGVETILGERGIRLSGGQRQRVALARAFYHGRSVLVMDEATSALDNETEQEIVEEIRHFKGKKTMIVIAHRLTTVQHCDRIYRLENGEITETGSPDQVLNNKKAVST
jgi:ATP-binding cassette subfamily C protein